MDGHHCTGPAGNDKYIYIHLLFSMIIVGIEIMMVGLFSIKYVCSLWELGIQ
jgi:hypothetical protein